MSSIPLSVCILRLSALGDVTHVVPLVRRIQKHWPETIITWVIGKFEHRLVADLPGVEFITVDKNRGLKAWRDLRTALRGHHFDVLLQCQVSFRSNLLATAIPAGLRVGFDWRRSKEMHALLVNRKISASPRQHVLDAIYSFGDAIGLPPAAVTWNLPISAADYAFADKYLPGEQSTLIISPCSSHPLRNWHIAGYAAVAEHAYLRHHMRVVLCGGPSVLERETGTAILRASNVPIIDLIGKDTLKQFLALLTRATVLLSPDSGPMHMANAVGTPVIGLHAATDMHRSGPYSDRRWSINQYHAAARKFMGKDSSTLRWGKKIERPGVMDLIEIQAVTERLDTFLSTVIQAEEDLD